MIGTAQMIATQYHRGQLYGERPYTYHLYQVADSSVQGYKGDFEDIIWTVGFLHDILEDTTCTEEVLRNNFQKDVVDAVVRLTKVKGETYTDYILKVRESALSTRVKTHDTLCNLVASVYDNDKRRILKYSKQLILLTEDI